VFQATVPCASYAFCSHPDTAVHNSISVLTCAAPQIWRLLAREHLPEEMEFAIKTDHNLNLEDLLLEEFEMK
jgi:hypothetical protein